jgi:hypothetical protein
MMRLDRFAPMLAVPETEVSVDIGGYGWAMYTSIL